MKYTVIILLFSLLRLNSIAQNADGANPVKDRLYNEITSYHQVEFRHIGCWGYPSKFYPKVDSFFKMSEPTACIDYFNDPSYILKYYSFARILFVVRNDSIAWNKLTAYINDSTQVDFEGWSGYSKFNEVMVRHYRAYLTYKYTWYGGTYNALSFMFDKPASKKMRKANKRIIKRKKEELRALLAANGMDDNSLLKYF